MENKADYFNFLDNVNENDCVKKSYKIVWKLMHSIYIPKQTSNKQITYLIKKISRNNNVKYYNSIIRLFTNFMSLDNAIKIFKIISNKKYSDDKIIKYIMKLQKDDKKKYNRASY